MDCCVCVLVETLFARKTGEMFFYDQGQSFVRESLVEDHEQMAVIVQWSF